MLQIDELSILSWIMSKVQSIMKSKTFCNEQTCTTIFAALNLWILIGYSMWYICQLSRWYLGALPRRYLVLSVFASLSLSGSVCVRVCLCVFLSVCLSVCLSVFLSLSLVVSLSQPVDLCLLFAHVKSLSVVYSCGLFGASCRWFSMRSIQTLVFFQSSYLIIRSGLMVYFCQSLHFFLLFIHEAFSLWVDTNFQCDQIEPQLLSIFISNYNVRFLFFFLSTNEFLYSLIQTKKSNWRKF